MKKISTITTAIYTGILSILLLATAVMLVIQLDIDKQIIFTSLLIVVGLLSLLLVGVSVANRIRKRKPTDELEYEDFEAEQALATDIEQYQQNFDRLSQAEQRLQAIVNLIPHAISVKDQQGKIILANQSYADFFGKRRRDIIGLSDTQIWPVNFESERIKVQEKEVIESYQANSISTWLTDAQNNKKFYKINKVPVVDPVLDEPVLLGISMDISEGYFREQILHARSRILESIVESAPLVETLQLLASEIRLKIDVEEISFVSTIAGAKSPLLISLSNDDSNTINNSFADGMIESDQFQLHLKDSEQITSFKTKELVNSNSISSRQENYLEQHNIKSITICRITNNEENQLGLLILTHKKAINKTDNYKKIIVETLLLSALALSKIDTENKLNEFNQVVAKSQSAIFVVNNNSMIISVNDSGCKIFATDESELLSHSLESLQPKGEMGNSYVEMITAISKSLTWRDEIAICDSNGICQKFQAAVSPSVSENDYSIVILSAVVEATQSDSEIKTLAFYDALTGLHNRGLLFERLQQTLNSCTRNNKQCALMLMDLDFFNKVNESLGHANGDVVLREIASRIKNTVRKEDIVARIDGDEFAIVIEGFKKPSMLRQIANNLMQNISRPIKINEKKIYPSVSVGIGVGPIDADKAEDLVKNVSMALYRAKVNGRNQIEFYEYKLNRESQDRLNLESEMREGLSKEEFFTMFQPIYSESGTKMVAAEALLRWKNPKRGLVSPMDFIPIAEETGLIKEIGHLVFDDTVKMLKKLGNNAIKIHVNLSARQFEDGHLPNTIKKLMEKNNLNSELLAIELTESLLMEGRQENIQQLEAICAMGISIAIDDFGTGYSSLSYLKTLPVDVLKIDRAFIKELDQDESEKNLVDIILAIAQKLNMGAVAEGVETPEQLQFLRQLKFPGLQIQGYLLSKPLMPDVFQRKLLESVNNHTIDIALDAG